MKTFIIQMESIYFLVESIANQMKTIIDAVESFNSLVECLFVFFLCLAPNGWRYEKLPITDDSLSSYKKLGASHNP